MAYNYIVMIYFYIIRDAVCRGMLLHNNHMQTFVFLHFSGTVFPDSKLDDKLTSVDPNLLAFILSLNEAKIKAILSTSWLEVIPILSESGLMTPSLRRRLTERNCTSFEKAEMILNHVATSPDGPVRLLHVIRRLSVGDNSSRSLVDSITKTISSLSDQCVASVMERRIKRVWFPSGSCWPKRIEASEPLDEDLYQYLYSQVWWLARSGNISKAFTLVNSNRSLHPDIQTALAEVALTTPSKDASLYNDLENLLLKCRQDGCWNSDLLCVRIHKRLVVFYFYTHQNMAKAYHHLYKGYEICTRIEPDEGTARIIASWGEYMHMIGDYEESRKSFALAVDHAERVPTWMKPMVEGVKIDKALFHVHRGNLYKDQRGSCPESNKEFEDAIKTLESLDVSFLPTSHLSFVHYVRARIAFYYQDIPKARKHTDDAMRLEPFEHSPYYRRAASFNQVLSIL